MVVRVRVERIGERSGAISGVCLGGLFSGS